MLNLESGAHLNWRTAVYLLSEVLPGSTGFEPDEINGLSPDVWTSFEVDDRDPLETTEELWGYCESLSKGMLIVVPFASYRPDVGPFFVHSHLLTEFWSSYIETFDDYPFSGDLIIVGLSSGRVLVVHHSGLIALLEGRPVNFG